MRVPPPPPPLHEFTKKSSDPNLFEKVDGDCDVDGDIEEGEVTETTELYADSFCPPSKEMPIPSRDHPVVQQLLKLGPKESLSSQPLPPPAPAPPPQQQLEMPESPEEGETTQETITLEYIQQKCEYQLLDKAFLMHLADINPISALHELAQKLGWSLPNLTVAFECGPPTMKMFIYKASFLI